MKKNKTICIALFFVVLVSTVMAAGQYKQSDARLSPKLLNYQGYLTDTLGNPINNSSLSLSFAIFDSPSGGSQKWAEIQSTVAVDKGIFNVLLGSITPIPDSVFTNSTDRWLELTVGGQVLSPRTRIVSSGYAYTSTYSDTALYARIAVADSDWIISDNNMYSGVSGNVGIGTNSPRGKLDVDGPSDIWLVDDGLQSGSQNIFLPGHVFLIPRTTGKISYLQARRSDNSGSVEMRFRTYNSGTLTNAMHIDSVGNVGIGNMTPRYKLDVDGIVCGGTSDTVNAVYGGVLSGYSNLAGDQATDTAATVVGGLNNSATDKWTFVGGGRNNTASAYHSTVGGGQDNTSSNNYTVVAGGLSNIASGQQATVGGGYYNVASGLSTVVGGGYSNIASNSLGTIGGGHQNAVNGYSATIAGGMVNSINAARGAILGGYSNQAGDSTLDTASAVCAGYNNSAMEKCAFVGGGRNNTASSVYATVGGGYQNTGSGYSATVGGGYLDTVEAVYGAILGGYNNQAGDSTLDTASAVCAGYNNTALGKYAFVGGGRWNTASGVYATVGGGFEDTANGSYATVGGGYCNIASGVRATVGGGFRNAASDTSATVGGGYADTASGYYATVGGGRYNVASGNYATVGGGYQNTGSGDYAAVGGGYDNTASGGYSFVASGSRNAAIGQLATVGGGSLDTAGGNYAVVGGGYRNNTASSTVGAIVAGGYYNTVSGSYSTVGGGYRDSSVAEYSFTVGNNSTVVSGYTNSAAFNGQSATASGQTRVGALSKVSGTFTIDHPLDPENKILNHYFVESPDMSNIYSGSVIIDAKGRAKVNLPDYFDALNRNPRVQLTGVGSSDVYVAEDFQGDQFSIGGKPGMKVYWTVIADRKDPSADITRILMPVEQPKTGGLMHRSLDDEFLVTTMGQLERMGKASGFKFRYASEENRYEEGKRMLEENKK